MRVRFIILLISWGFVFGCSDSDFNGSRDGKKKTGSGDQEDDVDEPAIIGGAYLTCAALSGDLNNPNNAQPLEIGCAINLVENDNKARLSGYRQDWVVTQNGQKAPVGQAVGSTGDRYHRKFTYTDLSFQQQELAVTISDGARSQSYGRNLNRLDPDLGGGDGVPDSFLVGWRITPANGQATGPNPFPADLTAIPGFVQNFTNDSLCDDGVIDPVFVDRQYGTDALSQVGTPLKFEFRERPCVILDYEDVKTVNGCHVIPAIVGKENEYNYLISPIDYSGISVEDIRKLAAKYRCERN